MAKQNFADQKLPSLRFESLLMIAVTLLVFVGLIILVFVLNMLDIIDQHEQENIRQRGDIAEGVIRAATSGMQLVAQDMSSWDDMYEYALGQNESFIAEEFSSADYLLRHDLDFLIVKSVDGVTKYEAFYDYQSRQPVSLPAGLGEYLNVAAMKMLLRFEESEGGNFDAEPGMEGLTFLNGRCYYVCAMPILNTAKTGQPAGAVFFGRVFNDEEMARLTGSQALNAVILPLESSEIQAIKSDFTENELFGFDGDSYVYYRVIADFFGENSLVLKLYEPRSLHNNGMDLVLLTCGIAGLVFLLLMMLIVTLLNRKILDPLARLSLDVEAVDSAASCLDTYHYGKSREFFTLSSSINKMLERMEQARQDLQQSTISLQTMEAVLNGMDACLVVTDLQTDQILFINDCMKRQYGLKDEVVGRICWQVLQHGFKGRCDFCPLPQLLENPDQPVVWFGQNTVNGRYFRNIDRIIEWSNGVKAHLQHSTDLTDMKQAESDLLAAKEAAEQASQAKSQFLSRMSHEMRTPMNAIIGMTGVARNTKDAKKKEYCLEKIDNASRHLLGVINDILDMSKIEANKLELFATEFNFEKMLVNIVDVVNFRAEEKQQNLIVNFSENIPPTLIADELRLGQVISNLLSNAIKFTPEGGRISLSVNKLSEEDGASLLRFEVADSGIGLSPEQQERLFTSFEQADGGIARKYGGTGLGLAICKSIVDKMGGEIWAESELGQGAKFIFTVKVKNGSATHGQRPHKLINKDDLYVLAVDDSPEIRDYFLSIMEVLGISCEVAPDGETALRMIEGAKERQYNIFFVDWRMPGLDGIELTRRIKSITHNNAVIIMISVADWGMMEKEALAAGVDRFVPKPLFPSMLLNAIHESLGAASAKPLSSTVRPLNNYKNHTLLLAEDVDINREVVHAVLEGSEIALDYAENGRQALELFAAQPEKYSLILMDIQMPGMDGFEATRRIRELGGAGAKVPIIAMTANVFREDIERCLQSGMDDHVAKPMDMEDLMEKLDRYLPQNPPQSTSPSTPPSAPPSAPPSTTPSAEAVAAPAESSGYEKYAPMLDIAGGLRRVMDNKKLYIRLLGGYDGRKLADVVALGLENQNLSQIQQSAHSLKGVAANLGIKEVQKAAAAMEAEAKKGEYSQEKLAALYQAVDEAAAAIAAFIAEEN